MNIGVSLPPAFLCGQPNSEHQRKMLTSSGGLERFLNRLRGAGVNYIELRAVRPGTSEAEVSSSVRAAAEAGFSLTVHGTLIDEPADLFWGRMKPVLDAQPCLTITVHSAKDRESTLLLLSRLSAYAQQHFPQARLALENNRSKKGDNMDLVECFGVQNTLRELNFANVGSCWDFGHFYWDHLTHPTLLPDELPPEDFIHRAIHTHIHTVSENTTHFPLTTGTLPLTEYLSALLKAGYTGVFNLEPEPERWPQNADAAEEIVRSAEILKRTLEQIVGGQV